MLGAPEPFVLYSITRPIMKIESAFSGILPLLLALFGLFSCSEPTTRPIEPENKLGMAFIPAAGKSTLMGSSDNFGKAEEERPRLKASFHYDFWMDSAEVTQAEFKAVLGRDPSMAAYGKGDDLPAYHVTYFDAVLYCNARSKQDGIDTVYTYQQAVFDSVGKAVELRSLYTDFTKAGFRLPTEAEWELAARAGVKTSFAWGDALDSTLADSWAWTVVNAKGKAQTVKSKRRNAFGLYDMFGNVMEWVNDWKAPLAEDSIQDFLGNEDPGLVQERCVKGGAFTYELRFARFGSRSEIYPTLGSMSKPYIGFRCALGAIQSGHYLLPGGNQTVTPPAFHDYDALKRLLGHDQAKLVFVNVTSRSRTLVFADFASKSNRLVEFHDDPKVFHPTISPDGNWVAYGDREEGDAREGEIKIRRLTPFAPAPVKLAVTGGATLPRWWVDSATSDTYLIYTTHGAGNIEASWKSSQTFKVKITAGAVAAPPVLLTQGGYHDGLSANGNWLATGYQRLRVMNLATKTENILFVGPDNGKQANDTSQACNVSLSPSASAQPELLLLDFGYAEKSAVVGRAYGLHEILFRLDVTGGLKRIYQKPKGFEAWQDAEWSNDAGFAIGTGQNLNGGYPAVIAIDLERDTREVIATGSNLRHPHLWINPNRVRGSSFGADSDQGARWADSLGRYNEPLADYAQEVFAEKMRTFWLQRNHAQVVGLGTSHLAFGMLPLEFKLNRAVNLASPGAPMYSQYQFLRQYVLPHMPKVKAIVFDVLLGNLFSDFDTPPPWIGSKGYMYDKGNDYWKYSLPAAFEQVMRYERTTAVGLMHDSLGGGGYHIFGGEGFSSGTPKTHLHGSGELPDAVVQANITRLRDLAKSLDSSGIGFVLVLFPESPHYSETPLYLKLGPKREHAAAILSLVASVCQDLPHCRFYDAHAAGNHDYAENEFVDDDHLNAKGARRLSARLDSLVEALK